MAGHIIRMGAVFKCIELIPKGVNYLWHRHRRNSRVSVRTWRPVEPNYYLLNCIRMDYIPGRSLFTQ
jgi:hypothetical protein